MNVGKTLFAQIMEFVPWTSFSRIVERHGGNAGVRRMPCAEQFRIMAFAQLTWRESLRDIEVTLAANTNKLYALGLRHNVHRSTLADANEARDWRMWADVAALLIRRARKLYRDCDLGLDWINTVYALDATTIDLCLSVFDWAPFRSAKAAVKMHTLLDLRGAIPAFIHISDGKMHEVNVLDFLPIEAGAFYVMDRHARQARHGCPTGVLDRDRPDDGRDLRSEDRHEWLLRGQGLSRIFATDSFQRSRVGQGAGFLDQQHRLAAVDYRRAVQKSLASGTFLQMDQAASAHQEISRYQRERGEDANLVRRLHLRAHRYRQEGTATRRPALHFATDSFRLGFREKPAFMRLAARSARSRNTARCQPIESIPLLTGRYCAETYIYTHSARHK
jgi:hypothetical protein